MQRATFFFAMVLCAALAGAQDWRGPAALEVTVEDARGKNLVGAEVVLVYLSPDGGGQLPSVLTGAGGKATISGLATGRWSVEVRNAGHMSFRAELTLSGEGKPVVESAAQQMTPGATSTMKVKFARGRGGAAPAAPTEPARAPTAVSQPLVAPPAEPAPAPPGVPAGEGAPAVGRVPAPAPAPAIEEAPVKEQVTAKPVARTPEPTAVPVPPPSAQPTTVPAKPPTPTVASVPEKAAQQPPAVPAKPSTPPVAPLPERVPQQPPTVPAKPPTSPVAPLPERAPQPPPVVQAKPGTAPQAPPPAPPLAPPAPAKQRLCVECPPGESAAWGEAVIAGGATAGCPTDLAARLKSVELAGVARLSAELGPGCRVIAVELPAGARFTGFRYEAQSQGVAADCLPGRGCPAGGCRFPFEPVVRQENKRTILLVGFESTAPDPRRAVVAGYSTYSKK